jgi:hypothetical protein
MAAVAGWRGSAARLAQVSDQEHGQLLRAPLRRHLANEGNQGRVSEMAVPLGPRDHEARAAQGQGAGSLDAARARLSEDERRPGGGLGHATPA